MIGINTLLKALGILPDRHTIKQRKTEHLDDLRKSDVEQAKLLTAARRQLGRVRSHDMSEQEFFRMLDMDDMSGKRGSSNGPDTPDS